MHVVTSFRSNSLSPAQAGVLIAEYLALEEARSYRRLCVTRVTWLALAFGAIALLFPSLPSSASLSGIGLCLAVPAWAWLVELRRDFGLTRKLQELPPDSAQVTVCEKAEKVIKKS
jgi:hypothetical protein